VQKNPPTPAFKILKVGFVFGLLPLALFMLACVKPPDIQAVSEKDFIVKLGEEFELKKDQRVGLLGTNFKIKILTFYNQPCPPNVKCIWSGIGIEFEYRYDGQVKRGINLVKAFGYKTTVIKSDYESYAILKIMKDEEN
jgi:hypothetical protein